MDLITVTRAEGLTFEVQLRDHVMTTDFSVGEGGQDGDVSVSLTPEMVENPNRVKAIVLDVELPKDVPEGDREKLKKMALRMPVPATFKDGPEMDIEMY